MLLHSSGAIFLVISLWTSVSIAVRECDILKFDVRKLADEPITGWVKMFRGFGKDYVFNSSATVTGDDLSIYDIEATVQHSVMGNNQYVMMPYKVHRKALCHFFNHEYRNMMMDELAKFSNLPSVHDPDVNYCDFLKKGNHYELANLRVNTSNLPDFTPAGTFKVVGSLTNRNTNVVSLSVLVITKLY